MRPPAFIALCCLVLSGCAENDTQPRTDNEYQPSIMPWNGTVDWGEPAGRTIRPGINTNNGGASCSSSFIFVSTTNASFYLASAAHCVADPSNGNTDTNGCTAGVQDIGSEIELVLLDGSTATGLLAYSSWNTMQNVSESASGPCLGNDFALIEIPAQHHHDVHPSALHFGGPTGLAITSTQTIYGFGASVLKQGVEQTYPKQGVHIEMQNEGFSHLVYLATPGIPGDSGGFITTEDGKALGIASTILLAPYPAANHYTDVNKAVEYLHDHSDMRVELQTWDQWTPSITPEGRTESSS